MKKLENKVAIITGGAGSIGKITAKLFLEEGAKVFLVDINEQDLKEVDAELEGSRIKYCAADVSKSEDVQKYVNQAVEAFGKIDIFFNNAGIEGVVKPLVDYPEDIFDKIMAVNVKGMWLGNKYVLPQMNEGGSIIMTSSVAGIVGFAGLGAYVTSKHAVVGIMRVSAIEAAPRKIRVNSVHPSPVNNRMMRSIEEGASAGHGAEVKEITLTNPLDQAMVKEGQAIYDLKCSACHRLSGDRLVGPSWTGVTTRRKPVWIINMITNVDMMLEKDEEAQKMLETCLVRMPNQNISEKEARSLIEFMRQNDGEK